MERGPKVQFFSLIARKKQVSVANLISNNLEVTDSIVNRNVEGVFDSIVRSKVTDNILFYISDYIARNLVASIDYQECATSVVKPSVLTDQQYLATPYATFLNCDPSIILLIQSCSCCGKSI